MQPEFILVTGANGEVARNTRTQKSKGYEIRTLSLGNTEPLCLCFFERVTGVYERMFEEINSDYIHKYDILRTLVFELLHFAIKMQPSANFDKQQINASQRISTLFLELSERQFPIGDSHVRINLRSASEYANQLNIHVNHLNRAVKEITEKTTSQIIAERIMQESKVLLKHSGWTVSEIAYALGFTEVTHFDNFFKKHMQVSPLKFRNV